MAGGRVQEVEVPLAQQRWLVPVDLEPTSPAHHTPDLDVWEGVEPDCPGLGGVQTRLRLSPRPQERDGIGDGVRFRP